ncbi:MAG: CCA tRNA nucleotidyltransferase [Alphaproteobacteria bacterium]|nr:CCA tRNA nucleotidyltransferase [Alphaproteobacteria bacterium]
MRLNPPWLDDADVQRLLAACAAEGIALRFVGGAVRDTLLMREVGDIDAATPEPAGQVVHKLQAQGIRVIPTGIDHGTVTALLGKRQVEITTLRTDVETDGRHAKVRPTDSWEEDANRRDFTMNALYLSPQGELYDPHHGAEDALAGRVRFIGDAAQRIEEDALRILRFFRFFATHGEPPADQGALVACAAKQGMIAQLSGERIAQEMRKLMQAAQPIPSLRLMANSGVAAQVFGEQIDVATLLRLTMLEHTAGVRVSVWARVAALLLEPEDALRVAKRWKLSKAERKHLGELMEIEPLHAVHPAHHHTRVMRVHGAAFYRDLLLLSAANDVAWDIAPWIALSREFVAPVFPVKGDDLKKLGIAPGKEMGAVLMRLEHAWEESGYTLAKEALLGMVPAHNGE